MENASKALIMAATVLVGIMIISIGVYLFSMFADYSKATYQKMEETQIAQFNAQFYKYHGSISKDEDEDGIIETGPVLCTVQDIITVANLAHQNNKKYDLLDQTEAQETTLYVQVAVEQNYVQDKENIEKWDETKKITFIKNNSTIGAQIKYYTCEIVEVNPITKRVNYIMFKEK